MYWLDMYTTEERVKSQIYRSTSLKHKQSFYITILTLEGLIEKLPEDKILYFINLKYRLSKSSKMSP